MLLQRPRHPPGPQNRPHSCSGCQEGRPAQESARDPLLVHDYLPPVLGQRKEVVRPSRCSCLVSYHDCDRWNEDEGEDVCRYVACNQDDRASQQFECLCQKWSTIKTSYQLVRQARATTATQDPIVFRSCWTFQYQLVLLTSLFSVL